MNDFSTTVCVNCLRGRETCEYCHTASTLDWQAMCDCGLYDFGSHLTDCVGRASRRWVIAIDYASAEESR